MIAASERMLPGRFVHLNAARKRSLIFLLYVVINVSVSIDKVILVQQQPLDSPASCFANQRGRATAML